MANKPASDVNETQVLCPSYRCESGAILLGIVQPDGKLALAPERLVVDQAFVDRAQEAGIPYHRFRFSGKCVRGRCGQWTGSRCGVIDRQMVELGTDRAVGELPECSIRPQCRWYKQEGALACALCPEVMSIPEFKDEEDEESCSTEVTLGTDRLRSAVAPEVTDSRQQAAEAIADRYFRAFSEQDWDVVLSLYADEFFRKTPYWLFRDLLVKFGENLGEYRDRQLEECKDRHYTGAGESSPLTVLTYHVSYAKGSTAETLTLLGDGARAEPRIVGHQIDSAALLPVMPGVSRR
jgi:hypothetical protein